MNTACYETECKFKQAMDDVERKDLQDPYAYSSRTRNVMRKRKRMKFTGRLKNIVKSGTSTERRFQALEVRYLRNLENKILLREHTDRKVKVKERNCKKVWKRRQKQFNAYMPGESCHKGRSDILFTHPHRERKKHVINLGGVKCKTHCTTVTRTSNRPWGKSVAKPTRSVPCLLCTSRCV